MLLSQAMEAEAGARAGEGLKLWRCSWSQRKPRLKKTQTCKSRVCYDVSKNAKLSEFALNAVGKELAYTKYSREN